MSQQTIAQRTAEINSLIQYYVGGDGEYEVMLLVVY